MIFSIWRLNEKEQVLFWKESEAVKVYEFMSLKVHLANANMTTADFYHGGWWSAGVKLVIQRLILKYLSLFYGKKSSRPAENLWLYFLIIQILSASKSTKCWSVFIKVKAVNQTVCFHKDSQKDFKHLKMLVEDFSHRRTEEGLMRRSVFKVWSKKREKCWWKWTCRENGPRKEWKHWIWFQDMMFQFYVQTSLLEINVNNNLKAGDKRFGNTFRASGDSSGRELWEFLCFCFLFFVGTFCSYFRSYNRCGGLMWLMRQTRVVLL